MTDLLKTIDSPADVRRLQRTDLRGLIIGYGYATLGDIAHWGPVLARLVSNAIEGL